MKKIVDFFVKNIVNSPKFNSPNPVSDMDLLLPEFKNKFAQCVTQYKTKYPDQDVVFVETYRSNTLQEQYYNSGASKIKKDGMHHFGIAGDSIFVINGKRTYKGDVNLLRKIYKQNGLTILGMWDPLHVQFIAVEEQQELRKMVNAATITMHAVATPEIATVDKTEAFMDGGKYLVMTTPPVGACTLGTQPVCCNGVKYVCAALPGGGGAWLKRGVCTQSNNS